MQMNTAMAKIVVCNPVLMTKRISLLIIESVRSDPVLARRRRMQRMPAIRVSTKHDRTLAAIAIGDSFNRSRNVFSGNAEVAQAEDMYNGR